MKKGAWCDVHNDWFSKGCSKCTPRKYDYAKYSKSYYDRNKDEINARRRKKYKPKDRKQPGEYKIRRIKTFSREEFNRLFGGSNDCQQ